MEFKPSGPRIIWVTPKFPLGTPDGARHATCSLIRHLVNLGAAVELMCLVPDGEPADREAAKTQLGVLSCAVIRRSASKRIPLRSLWTPFTFRTFTASGVRSAFKKELVSLLGARDSAKEPLVVFDGLHAFGALSAQDLQGLAGRSRGIIYRAHNFETSLWEQCAKKARMPWTRAMFHYQTALVKQFERRVARSVGLIAPVSEEDAVRFRVLAPAAAVSVVPIGMDFPREKAAPPVGNPASFELLFVGRLDWLPNRSGLSWFLEKIWPLLKTRRPNAQLKIVGIGDAGWLANFRGLSGINVLGKVENLEPLYEASVLAIAPLFQGSGTRVKILESARYARPVLTTALGAEGAGLVPGISYFRAETEKEWLDLLETLTNDECRNVGLSALQAVRDRFNNPTIAGEFLKTLNRRFPEETSRREAANSLSWEPKTGARAYSARV